MSKTYKLIHSRSDFSMSADQMRDHADTGTEGVQVSVRTEAFSGHVIEHTFKADDATKAEEVVRTVLGRTPFLVYHHKLVEVSA